MSSDRDRDRYGTFQGKGDDPAELECGVEERSWRAQRSPRWMSRTRLVLGVVSVLGVASVLVSSRQSSQGVRINISDSASAADSAAPINAPDVFSVHVYRRREDNSDVGYSSRGNLEVDFSVNASKDNADAWAIFNDSLHSIGWSQLWVKTANLSPEECADKQLARKRREDIMYAAGYAEGLLTHHRIDEHYFNVMNTFFPDGNAQDRQTLADLHDFFRQNLEWMEKQIRHHNANPHLADADYWETVSTILRQFEGLVAGYHRGTKAASPASTLDLLLMNYDGDLQDLIPVVQRARGEVTDDVDPITQEFYVFLKNLKCSALIRILPDFSDLVWGHSTWDTYASMNRIFKHYDVPLPGDGADGAAVKRKISMSSSPAYLSSVDDWYMTDAGLGVLETTHGVFDSDLYDFVTPHSVPCWLRSKVANFLGTDGPSWAATFAKYNSGTYNNQWMIVDTKRFVKGSGFESDGLTILEQLPGFVQVKDVSTTVNAQGYWASYNVPYFATVYARSGFMAAYKSTNGSASWSHESCPRAKIFQRDAPTITSLDDFKRVIRSNNWRDDPLSAGHASHAVASRYDLETGDLFSLDGAIDAKVTTLDKFARLECDAEAGPTHDNNPVFEWTPEMQALVPSMGHPARFAFGFVTMAH